MRAMLSFIFLFLLVACNNNKTSSNKTGDTLTSGNARLTHNTWDSANRFQFISECMDGDKVKNLSPAKAYSYCNCMLGRLEVRFPVPDSILNVDTVLIHQMEKECLK